MKLEILTAQELYDKGEIDALEVRDLSLFADKKVIIFSNPEEGVEFAYNFVHKYLIPKYGKDEAAKFPMVKIGPASEDLFAEEIGAIPKKQRPIWFAIPEDRFSDIEEFLGRYNA
ncbi:MAG: hypothetical protein ABIJ14_01965 [Nanoarchaeota archaeon]|nr:hypothetical protein [Nanoarchaeota archaeon]